MTSTNVPAGVSAVSARNLGLIHRDQSCLVVIDVQQHFLDKLQPDDAARVVERTAWLMHVSRALDIPIVATNEDPAENGPLVPALARLLPRGNTIFDKSVFDLHAQEDIRAAIEATRRDCFILTGLETDVCVAHSALGLASAGYRTVVIEDACASPPPFHEAGLGRLAVAGVTVTSVKGIFYEWARDLATIRLLMKRLTAPPPEGVTL